MQTGEIAKLLGRADNTIRNWTERFADFLSEDAAGRDPDSIREYDDADLYVLATIDERTKQGDSTEMIIKKLRQGYRVTQLPPKRSKAVQQVQESVEIIPVDKAQAEINLYKVQAQELQVQLQFVITQMEAAQQAAKEETERRIDAEKKAERLAGELSKMKEIEEELRKAQDDLRQMERMAGRYEELQNQLNYLQSLLDEEKKRKRGFFGR